MTTIMQLPENRPARFRHLTHAELHPGGRVAVGTLSRYGLLGHFIDAPAPSQDLPGVIAAMGAEDRELSRPFTQQQLDAMERVWPGLKKELRDQLAATGSVDECYAGLDFS